MKKFTSTIINCTLTLLLVCSLAIQTINAQAPTRSLKIEGRDYPVLQEDYFKNTYWEYERTYHVESKRTIHESSDNYNFFVHFKEDYTHEYSLNNKTQKGTWLLDVKGSEIYFDFRNIRWWKVSKVNKNHLVMEFKVGSSLFAYEFTGVSQSATPFGDLDGDKLADLYEPDPSEKITKKQRLAQEAKKKRGEKLKAKMDKKRKVLPAIEVQMTGGGFFGGIDPVYKDYTHLKTNGRLINEFESIQKGLIKQKKDIPREKMEQLISFIEEKGFFDMKSTYDCTDGDCMRRKRKKPTPVPLTIAVTHGTKRKVVVITVYGQDNRRSKYVKYPKELDIIIDNIRSLVQREFQN